MYIPKYNRMEDIDAMAAFMRQHSFAILVSNKDKTPIATHLPFTVSRDGEEIRLLTHFAKANEQWSFLGDQESLVIFAGPHAYISPTHYDKHESVPTWNYITVHAYGTAELIRVEDQPERLEAMLVDMIGTYDPAYQAHWESLSDRYRDGMKQGIVGVDISVTRLEGKAKISQNRNTEEQSRIAHSLSMHENSEIAEIGYAMQKQLSAEAT
jgi:transcriptional regulator